MMKIKKGKEKIWREGKEVEIEEYMVILILKYIKINRWKENLRYGEVKWIMGMIEIEGVEVLDKKVE